MKKEDKGVSPVIGVILMVAITVIMGVVIGEFIFGLTDRFEPSATANINFNQNLYWDGTGNYYYNVTARVDSMETSDYLAVTSPTSDSAEYTVTRIGSSAPSADVVVPSEVSYAPDSPGASPSIQDANDGRILIRQGDKIRVSNLQSGDVVQVFGGVEGEEVIVVEYTVLDVVPEAYKP